MNNEIQELKQRLARAEQLLEQWIRAYKEPLRFNSTARGIKNQRGRKPTIPEPSKTF